MFHYNFVICNFFNVLLCEYIPLAMCYILHATKTVYFTDKDMEYWNAELSQNQQDFLLESVSCCIPVIEIFRPSKDVISRCKNLLKYTLSWRIHN